MLTMSAMKMRAYIATGPPRRLADKGVTMSNVNETVELYVTAWNERDPDKRRAIIAKAWTEDASYLDPARSGKGHDGISAMIETVQAHFPGYSFRLKKGADAH